MKNNKALLAIVALAFCLRLFYISDPVLEWHSFRQADTASITYEYVQNGVDILHPRFHDFSNIASGKDNLEGYRMVEFPWIHALLASILRLVPQFSLVVASRLFSVLFSLVTLLSLYFFVKLFSNKKTALLAAATFALLPYAVFYSRVILPDPIMLALSTASLTFFAYWLERNKWWQYLASFVLLGLAALTKPFVLFLAPVYLALLLVKLLARSLKKEQFFWSLLLPVSLVPLLWWRNWITQFPSGIPASDWLYNGLINGKAPRFQPVWFRWLGYERVMKLILGYFGTVFFLPILLHWKKLQTTELLVYGSWWVSIAAYFTVIARGNIQHDYYQILALPIICITVAKGAMLLAKKLPPVVVAGLYLLMLLFSYNLVKEYYKINHWEYQRAGQRVQELVPKDAIVIAPAFGDTSFLFQTRHRGWPIGFEIDKKIAMGAQYYVTTSYDDEARMLESQYETVEKTPEYLIFNLQNPL
ncbi:MAG: phospholipid carrier-dependent glycosyltransferase [Candidatus Pacebacteria bacterium]|nr:phospholipid carrier-dependent glycosyltransferase [Candidatus Paceibacterota bacterium]